METTVSILLFVNGVEIMTRPGPGKFEFNDSVEISEYLYNATLEQQLDDSFGDSSTGNGWFALFLNVTPGLDVAGDNGSHNYIAEEQTSGFFYYEEYPDEEEAQYVFDTLRERFDVDLDSF